MILWMLAAVNGSAAAPDSSLAKRIWSFDWRQRTTAEAAREVHGFHVAAVPVRGGVVRRNEGEFGAIRSRGISYHKGIDFIAAPGTPVRAAASGFICYNDMNGGPDQGYGYTTIMDHGNNFYTLYAHLRNESPRAIGEWVEAGQRIGSVGRSGNAMRVAKEYQYQLHFEIIHSPSGLMNFGGLRLTLLISPRTITTLREIGEEVYGLYWGGVLNPDEFGTFPCEK
jgi:murein DD-endopeptidase MepM/ murein hydrolase activator NlpD